MAKKSSRLPVRSQATSAQSSSTRGRSAKLPAGNPGDLDPRFYSILKRLQIATSECRPDMHEPDEQGISARILGYKLDNARGDNISGVALQEGWQEFVVVISDEALGQDYLFNLADLIALARRAQ